MMSVQPAGLPDRAWNFNNNEKWPYDRFVRTYILKMMQYGFVQEHYDKPIPGFRYPPALLERLISTLPLHPVGTAWFGETLDALAKAGVVTLFQWIDRIATRKKAEAFLDLTGLPLQHLMALVDFFKQWWFPFGAQLRQLVDDADRTILDALVVLKGHGFANGFDLLETGRAIEGREALSRKSGLLPAVLLDLVHRADVTRAPYVSGGTVKRCWAIGYNSLEKLCNADPQEYFARVTGYYASLQKPLPFDARFDYIKEFLGDLRRMPRVVEARDVQS